MAENLERRDISTVLTDLRVSVTKIETTQNNQAEVLRRLENKLDLGVFREEYERRHSEIVVKIDKLWDTRQQDIGSNKTWRIMFSAALGLIAVVQILLSIHAI